LDATCCYLAGSVGFGQSFIWSSFTSRNLIVLVLVTVHLVLGVLGGWLAWRLGQVLKTRLDGTLSASVG
jgi:hypothetical protein